jgi:KDO2-lipid IV(A) lauroyltransferase
LAAIPTNYLIVEKDIKDKKKKKKGNIVADYLLYLLVRLVVAIFYCFPIEANLRTACWLGRLMWKYYHRGRQRALDNLRASFPDKDEAWLIETGRRSFEHLVMMVMDVLFTPRLVKLDKWQTMFSFHNVERIKWLMKEEKGLLMVTGHYGNFEIIGYLMSLYGLKIYSIARPLDNRFVNRWLMSVRESKGQKIIDKKGAAEQMDQLASEGATLCFIADQDAGKKGVFADFFGRRASTYKSIGLLAMQHNMPIVVGGCRQHYGKFFFEMEPTRIIRPEEWADKPDPLKWITQEYTRGIEDCIRKDPTQYWWLHRRWKTRPKEERQALKK